MPTSFEDETKPLAAVTFVREVSLRYRRPRRVAALNPITAPAKAAEFMRRLLPDNVREHFLALFLDGRNAVASYYVAATGTANSCPVGVREVWQAAILSGAVGVIIGHNHPSGETTASREDAEVTARFRDAGTLLGIPLLDHLILGCDGFYSFRENGLV